MDLTDEQINAAATLQQIGEEMTTESTLIRPDGTRRWSPSYIRRTGRRLLSALESLAAEQEPT